MLTSPDRRLLFALGPDLLLRPSDLGPTPLPTVAIQATPPATQEGATIQVRVVRSFPTALAATFSYQTLDGTAVSGVDYTGMSGTGTIAAGETFTDILIPTAARSGTQGSRAFSVQISNALQSGDLLTITTNAVTATIVDAVTTVSLTVSPLIVAENEGLPQRFRVATSIPAPSAITFNYTTQDGSALAGTDYTAISGTGATIPAGQSVLDFVVNTVERAGFQGARTLSFVISNAAMDGGSVTILTASATGTIAETEAPTGDHAYFETLLARPDYWKAHSMRPQAGQTSTSSPYYDKQLLARSAGGYAQNPSSSLAPLAPYTITYDPASDTHPSAQDAAKCVVPCFVRRRADHVLSEAVDASTTSLPVTSSFGVLLGSNGAHIRIDDEVMQITGLSSNPLTVTRGLFGTTPAAHAAGAPYSISTNSVPLQVQFPLGLERGYSYLVTWDAYWTADYMDFTEHSLKTFQFRARGGNIWMEFKTLFPAVPNYPPNQPAPGYNRATDVYHVNIRSYQKPWVSGTHSAVWSETDGNTRGPDNYNGSSGQPVLQTSNNSTLGYQIAKPNEWARWTVEWTFPTDDWSRCRLWVATESRDAALIYDFLCCA